jgi:hypothetical protein
MQIVIDIPKEFESHFELDRFSDSLGRIENDVKNSGALSGRYERETITMIRKAIENGTPLPKGHGDLKDANDIKKNNKRWIGYIDEDMIERLDIAIDKQIPTIIEADEEGAEE